MVRRGELKMAKFTEFHVGEKCILFGILVGTQTTHNRISKLIGDRPGRCTGCRPRIRDVLSLLIVYVFSSPLRDLPWFWY